MGRGREGDAGKGVQANHLNPLSVRHSCTINCHKVDYFVDKKKFFMGDMPTELDCAAFGQLAQIRWATPDTCPGKTLMKGKLKHYNNDYLLRRLQNTSLLSDSAFKEY